MSDYDDDDYYGKGYIEREGELRYDRYDDKLEDARCLAAAARIKLQKMMFALMLDPGTQHELSGPLNELYTLELLLSSLSLSSSSSSLTAGYPVSNSAAADDGETCLALKLAWEKSHPIGNNSAAVVYGSPAEPTEADLEAIKTAQEELNRGYSASNSSAGTAPRMPVRPPASNSSAGMPESKESYRPPAPQASSVGVQQLALNGLSIGEAPPNFTHTPPKGSTTPPESKGAGRELAAMLARRRAGIPE